jgi:hypothetical protein
MKKLPKSCNSILGTVLMGQRRLPWSLRRGKGSATGIAAPTRLAQRAVGPGEIVSCLWFAHLPAQAA